MPDVPDAIRLYFHLITADGAANLIRTLGANRPDWRIRRLLRLGRMRRPARRVVVSLLAAAGHRRLAELIAASGATSTDVYWQRTSERSQYIRDFTLALDAAGIDALVMPPHALPALRHGSSIDLNPAASYAFLANLLGMPAGVVPATRVRADEESDRPVTRDLTDRAARRVELGSAGTADRSASPRASLARRRGAGRDARAGAPLPRAGRLSEPAADLKSVLGLRRCVATRFASCAAERAANPGSVQRSAVADVDAVERQRENFVDARTGGFEIVVKIGEPRLSRRDISPPRPPPINRSPAISSPAPRGPDSGSQTESEPAVWPGVEINWPGTPNGSSRSPSARSKSSWQGAVRRF